MVLYINHNHDVPIAFSSISRDLLGAVGEREFYIQLFNDDIDTVAKNMNTFKNVDIKNIEIYETVDRANLISAYNLEVGKLESIHELLNSNGTGRELSIRIKY